MTTGALAEILAQQEIPVAGHEGDVGAGLMKFLERGAYLGETKGFGTVVADPVFEKVP